jgi:hypothetical protein
LISRLSLQPSVSTLDLELVCIRSISASTNPRGTHIWKFLTFFCLTEQLHVAEVHIFLVCHKTCYQQHWYAKWFRFHNLCVRHIWLSIPFLMISSFLETDNALCFMFRFVAMQTATYKTHVSLFSRNFTKFNMCVHHT